MKLLCLLLLALVTACAVPRSYRTLSPDAPVPMAPTVAYGEWLSTFGVMTIETDNSRGGMATGAVRGSWTYERNGTKVTGTLLGTLNGNVLRVQWSEPTTPTPLTGQAFLIFDTTGEKFNGTWWTNAHDRMGALQGWRAFGSNPAILSAL